jgi:hypothetical protein
VKVRGGKSKELWSWASAFINIVLPARYSFTPPTIKRNPQLTKRERYIEGDFIDWIEEDWERAVRDYCKLRESENGRVLNPDIARELSRFYKQSDEDRARYAVAVHEPASALVKEIYHRRLRKRFVRSRLVFFTAGGAGAGKTTAFNEVMGIEQWKRYHTVYDSTLSSFESASVKIEQALAAHKQALILYVHRPIGLAVQGVIDRALERGRVLPIDEVARGHYNAQCAIFEIIAHYATSEYRERVAVRIANNSNGTKGAIIDMTIHELEKARYPDLETVMRLARGALENVKRTRSKAGEPIPETLYRILARA